MVLSRTSRAGSYYRLGDLASLQPASCFTNSSTYVTCWTEHAPDTIDFKLYSTAVVNSIPCSCIANNRCA